MIVLVPMLVATAMLGGWYAIVLPDLPPMEVRHDPDASFQAFRTYCWKDAAPRSGPVSEAEASLVRRIDQLLSQLGLERVPLGAADLIVSYRMRPPAFGDPPSQKRKTNLEALFRRGVQEADPALRDVPEGALVLEVARRADGEPVWQAASLLQSRDKEQFEADLNEVVGRLLSMYPPPAPPAPDSPQGLPPAEAAWLLDQLDLSEGTPLTLVKSGRLPASRLLKVAIECGDDVRMRRLLASWIDEWNRTDGGRRRGELQISAQLDAAQVVLVRIMRVDQQRTVSGKRPDVGWAWGRIGRYPVPLPAFGTRPDPHEWAPVFAYVLVKTPEGYEVVWRFTEMVEVDHDPKGAELWKAFRGLLHARVLP